MLIGVDRCCVQESDYKMCLSLCGHNTMPQIVCADRGFKVGWVQELEDEMYCSSPLKNTMHQKGSVLTGG